MCKDIFLKKFTFKILKKVLEKISLELLFILKKDLLRKDLIITLILIINSNFILFYLNKNYSLKFIFNILKLKIN